MNIKEHIKKYQTVYACVATGVVVTVITTLVVKNNATKLVKVEDSINTIVIGEHSVLKNVSFITANRQGPPSWVVRCLETNEIFTSQRAAAEAMGLPTSDLSRHLNGILEHVNGYHFERICMAA